MRTFLTSAISRFKTVQINYSSTWSSHKFVTAVFSILICISKWNMIAVSFNILFNIVYIPTSITEYSISWSFNKTSSTTSYAASVYALKKYTSKSLISFIVFAHLISLNKVLNPFGNTYRVITATLNYASFSPYFPSMHYFIKFTLSSSDILITSKKWLGYDKPIFDPFPWFDHNSSINPNCESNITIWVTNRFSEHTEVVLKPFNCFINLWDW